MGWTLLGARAVLAALRAAALLRCPQTPSHRLGEASPRSLSKPLVLGCAIAVLVLLATPCSGARLKDVAAVEGARQNQLWGYGIVAGLNGTGDGQQALFTVQSVLNMLRRRGLTINVNPRQLQIRNVAAVSVTAVLPPFARQGTRIDAVVSSLGDAKSLQGGTLLLSPLYGADGEVYAVAQGSISLGGGFSLRTLGATAQKSHPTAALLASGAIVEKEVPVALGQEGRLAVTLHRPDFTTARRIVAAVNLALGRSAAQAVDAGTVTVHLLSDSPDEAVATATALEGVEVVPDRAARVVVNERTGTVIIGNEVRVTPVAIAHGSLNVTVKTDFGVSQPAPFSGGETVIVPDTSLRVEEGEPKNLFVLRPGVTLGELVAGLNALGVTPQDLIAVLEALRAAGSLEAELEVM